nr:hypothetical protein [Phycisphaerales bacterium]
MNQSPGNSTRRTWPLITRGRLRWGIALAAVVSVWWVGTRSPLVRWVVSSRLMGITGVEMVEGSVSIGLSGHLVFEDAVLRIPAVMGTAGEVFRVRRLDAAVSWRTLLGLGGASSPSIREVLLIEPRVRVSQDRESGRLNIAGLGSLAGGAGSSGGTSGGTAGPRLIPRIQIDGGVVEIGEHGGEGSRDTYTVLKHVDVSGLLTPGSSRKDGSVEFTIREETTSISAGEKRPIKIAGTMRGGGGSLELSGIDLRQWPASNWPSRIRPVVEMLDIKGEIGRTNLTYSTGGVGAAAGIHASMELIDVAVNLPVTEDAREAWSAEKPLLRMSGVNGLIELTDSSIQASISGDVEEVPYRVRLLYEGTSADSPFRCEVHTSDFKVERGLRILRFVPPIVRERLADFSWPTGRITSTVVITRSARPEGDGDAGTPAGLRISGEMEISDAVSAFARFPYEFQDLTGKVRFSDERIDLLDIRGRSATGAVLRASGFIEPPTADSHCVIDVHVDDLRIDEAVLSALSVRRKGIAPVIFNREQHSRLVAAGLIARPGDQHAPAPTPRFGLDGLANVHTRVIRPAGPDTEWQEETAIDFDSISILPEWFPLPMVARGVEVRIGDDTMTVRGGEYIPVTGGRATADARVDYDIIINPETKGSPELTVRAEGVPANRLLHYAIGAAIDRANRDQGSSGPGPRLRGILDDLNPTGPVTGELRLFNDEHGDGRVGALIRAGPLTLRPAAAEFTPDSEALDPAGGDLEVSDVIGTVEITDRLVGFEFSGTMSGGAEAESAD